MESSPGATPAILKPIPCSAHFYSSPVVQPDGLQLLQYSSMAIQWWQYRIWADGHTDTGQAAVPVNPSIFSFFLCWTLWMCTTCKGLCEGVVNCPTRWSLSSSWRWQPQIGLCRLLRPLLRAGMTVLTQFFCKMYFLYVSRGRKKKRAVF